MDRRTVAQLAEMCSGELRGDSKVIVGPAVIIDSRDAEPGALFVALPGERVDGHSFVAKAAAAGASAALVTHLVEADIAQIVVPDTATGLASLSADIVSQARLGGLLTVGITGSSGKTSTKDLLAQIMGSAGKTVASKGSQNNEIGVPLTAARVDRDTRFLVSEMGSRGIGHISTLTNIVAIDVALVLNVGIAHVGEFGSQAAIAHAKSELVDAARAWVVLNADDELVAEMKAPAGVRVASFGVGSRPSIGEFQVWATDLSADDLDRYRFTLHTSTGHKGSLRLQVLGKHQVANATAAAAAALCAGLEFEQITQTLFEAQALSGLRMQLDRRADGLLVLNDSYNANPDSMKAAVASVTNLRRPGGKVLAVLGDMLELGEQSADLHREIGAFAAQLGVDHIVTVGDFGSDIAKGVQGSETLISPAHTASDALEVVQSLATPLDVVLVKASRTLALERVAFGLAEREE